MWNSLCYWSTNVLKLTNLHRNFTNFPLGRGRPPGPLFLGAHSQDHSRFHSKSTTPDLWNFVKSPLDFLVCIRITYYKYVRKTNSINLRPKAVQRYMSRAVGWRVGTPSVQGCPLVSARTASPVHRRKMFHSIRLFEWFIQVQLLVLIVQVYIKLKSFSLIWQLFLVSVDSLNLNVFLYFN